MLSQYNHSNNNNNDDNDDEDNKLFAYKYDSICAQNNNNVLAYKSQTTVNTGSVSGNTRDGMPVLFL